jgi:small subunit ribosomal protein S8
MVVTDTIADTLTRIRNASAVQHQFVLVSNTKVVLNLVTLLKEEGYIKGFELTATDSVAPQIRIALKYKSDNSQPAIQVLKRISRPGLRKYIKSNSIPKVLGGFGVAILSTSQGLMTGVEAKSRNLGGEVLCYVW